MPGWFTPRKPLALPPTTTTPSQPSSSNSHPYQHFESIHSHFPSLSSGGEGIEGKVKDGVVEHYHFRPSASHAGGQGEHEEGMEEDEEEVNDHLYPEHATSSSFNPQAKTLFRLLEHGRVLEIRSLSFIGSQTDKVLRLSFSRRLDELERNISFLHPLNEVITVVLTSSGNGKETRMYRLDLPLVDGVVQYARADTWEQTLGTRVEGYELVSERDVVIRAGSGLGRLNWDDESEEWNHIPLKTPSYLPSLSLSRFNPFSPPHTPNPRSSATTTTSSSTSGSVTAITSHIEDDQAWIYALTGDGKLRTWAMGSGVVVGGVDVGEGGKGMVRTFNVEEGHWVVVYSGRGFKFHAVSTEGEFGIRLIGTIESPVNVGGGELRGLEVRDERLWTLWDVDGGRGLIMWVDLGEILGRTEEEGLQMVGIGEVMNVTTNLPLWRTARSPLEDSEPTFDSAYFEALLPTALHDNEDEDDYSDIPDTFLEHLFFPGRFSMHTLQACLEDYVESVAEQEDLPSAVYRNYPTLLEKTKGIVGCAVDRPRGWDEGYDPVEQYRRDLKNEWLGFWARVQACDKQARWPVCLAEMGEGVVVVLKEGVVVPSRVDELGLVIKMVGEQREVESSWTEVGHRGSEVASMPPGPLMKYYPTIAPPSVRTQLSSLVRISRSLAGRLSVEDLNDFEGELFATLCQPLDQAPEEFGAALYETRIRDQIALEDEQEEPTAQLKACTPIHKGLNMLLNLMMATDSTSKSLELASYLGLAMSISALSQQVHVRYLIARDLLILVLHVASIIDTLDPGVDADIYADLVARSMSVCQKCEALRWIVQQNGTEAQVAASILAQTDENKDDLPFDFNELRMSGSRSDKKVQVDAGTSYSLVHSVMASAEIPLPMETDRIDYVPIACSSLRLAISSSPNDHEVIASAADVTFADRLVEHGHPERALMLIARYPPQVGLTYVQAKALARLDRIEDAVRGFEQVAAVIDTSSWLHGGGSRSGLERVLPNDAQTDISSYYRYVLTIFERASHTPSIIHFAKLAINSAATGDPTTEMLWTKIFRAYLESKRYEEAYVSMISNPFVDLFSDVSGKERPLGNLINAMCHDNEVQRLLALSFIGFEDVIENELIFKARNSDPLAFPNYHQVLYAYYMQKKKYKDAGISMYQQGRRLGEHLHMGSDDFFAVATLQAQCYLAAIAAFSEVRPEYAWATLPVTGHSLWTAQTRKRRKLTVHIPAKEFSEYNKDVEIVTLADIRKDYALILATLKVATRFDMRAVDGPLPTSKEVVALQYEAGLYDDAFDTAHGLGEDMTPLFEHLTERCLDLTDQADDDDETGLGMWLFSSPLTCAWDGTTPDKAWRYLQIQLARHDTAKDSQSYAEAVTTRILTRKQPLPVWLVQAELSRFPEGLIRKSLEHGMVEMAMELCGERLKNTSQPTKLGEGGLQPAYTPFTLMDQVVVAGSDERYGDLQAVQASRRLRTQMEKQIAMVKALKV